MEHQNLKPARLYLIYLIWSLLPLSRCFAFKRASLRWAGATVGKGVRIWSTARIQGDCEVIIGDDVFIGSEAMICGPEGSKIIIEDKTTIASRAYIVTGFHEYSAKADRVAGKGRWADIVIKEGSCLSTMSMVLPGKTVGKMSHVAAGSVVTHDVPDYVRVAGVPARVIKNFLEEE